MNTKLLSESFQKLDFLTGRNININGYAFQLLGISLDKVDDKWDSKAHYHEFYELHYVIEGNCLTVINNIQINCLPNHFYIIPVGAVHSHSSTNGLLSFAMRWKINSIESCRNMNLDEYHDIYKYVKQLRKLPIISIEDKETAILSDLMDIIEKSEFNARILSQIAVIGLLLKVSELFNSISIGTDVCLTNTEEVRIVDMCLQFIAEHYSEDISVNDVADNIYLSYGYISRLFKKITGNTIMKEINIVRLNRAQYLLKTNNASIASIASNVGFKTENYFATLFKKDFDMTPSVYRKSFRRLNE